MGVKEEEIVTEFQAGTQGHHLTNDECIYSEHGSTAVWKLYFRRIDTCQVSDGPLQPSGHMDVPLCPTLYRFLPDCPNRIIKRITKFPDHPALFLLQSLEANHIWENSKTT